MGCVDASAIGVGDAASRAQAAAEAAARQSYGRLVAFLAAQSHDLAAAEDALSDAFAAALVQWPKAGVPDRPEAWLLAVARRRGIDALRRRKTTLDARPRLTLIAEEAEALATQQDEIPDERLRLLFACAHPAIESSVRAPLMVQTVLGFDAATIASAFLVPPATMAQRLVRAKARIKQMGVPFRVPGRSELPERLEAVLAAVYATFAEGWADATGTDARRRNLAEEGIWLARLVATLMPDEPEALCLLGLMLFAESRRPARRSEAGDYVPLSDQDVSLWNSEMIGEAEALLRRAGNMPGIGRYQLEAAVQAVHAARRFTGRTDWDAIVRLYDAQAVLSSSPVVRINRAVAIAETEGPRAGLAALDIVAGERGVEEYQPYWAARAELLARVGEVIEARDAFERALGIESDEAVRRYLLSRRSRLVA